MINLDDTNAIRSLDAQNYIEQINQLPQQLEDAWQFGLNGALTDLPGINNVIIAAVGTSAVGAEMLAASTAMRCRVPITVHREYMLPAWAAGPETLLIASSHSGDSEEVLSAFEQARAGQCRLLVLTTGGKLAALAEETGCPIWLYEHTGQPRAALGYAFGLLLAVMYRLGLVPDPTADLHEALHAMRNIQTNLIPDVPLAFNPAKRMAGQLVGRWVALFAADFLSPVARRWKSQLSETAKAWAQFELIPEMNHSTLAGLNNPENVLINMIALFLTAPSDNPRNRLRLDYTRQLFMTQGINTDVIQARGENPLAHIWTMLLFGDYTSYYLALAYGEDPAAADVLTMFTEAMNKTPSKTT
jgi:glucose/mannose-6-phosphate isomerase